MEEHVNPTKIKEFKNENKQEESEDSEGIISKGSSNKRRRNKAN
jgi:hypothetical protein